MPRGWHQLPGGWWQRSIRGRRPPTEMASRSAVSSGWVCAASGEVTIAAAFEAAQSPGGCRERCDWRDQEFGGWPVECVHGKPLKMALEAAQERSKVGPSQERLDSCRQFIERAKKRVFRAEEVIARAVE